MNMIENVSKARGEFTLICYKDGKVVDKFEDKNLVVNDARVSMSTLLSGKNGALGITSFVIGTKGHNETSGDILTPKAVGQDGYDETRTQLFSEEQGSPFYYTVKWEQGRLLNAQDQPVNFTSDVVEFIAKGQKKNQSGSESQAENARIPVKITLQNNAVQYEFEIPESAANGMDGQSVVAYTEAGLKCGNKLFSLKCFASKVITIYTLFNIIFKIIF